MQEKQSFLAYIRYRYIEQSRAGLGMSNFMVKYDENSVFLGRMVFEWREREHGDVDREVLSDVNIK